jgi:hypothetical protein
VAAIGQGIQRKALNKSTWGIHVTNKQEALMLEWQCFSVFPGARAASLHILLIYFVLK